MMHLAYIQSNLNTIGYHLLNPIAVYLQMQVIIGIICGRCEYFQKEGVHAWAIQSSKTFIAVAVYNG